MECSKCDMGHVCASDLNFYCNECHRMYTELSMTRCFTFCAVYCAETGRKLSSGFSQVHYACAERTALWKLDDEDNIPKVLVVCRVRRNKNRITFGDSKPCKQCICTMHFYNVQRVAYSQKKNRFQWTDLNNLENTYSTDSKLILNM